MSISEAMTPCTLGDSRIRKLEYYDASGSERHIRDIARMNGISGDQISTGELNEWLERLGLREHWEAAQAHVD